MQIRIVQTEIEEAIRNHILSQIMVREGVDIAITLSATRGEEGFVATIDITNPTGGNVASTATAQTTAPVSAAVAASPTATTAPAADTPVTAPAKPVTIRKAAKPIEASVAGLSPSTNEPAEAVGDTMPPPFDVDEQTSTTENAPVAAAEPATEAPATPAPPKGRSLFGGLTTPTNA